MKASETESASYISCSQEALNDEFMPLQFHLYTSGSEPGYSATHSGQVFLVSISAIQIILHRQAKASQISVDSVNLNINTNGHTERYLS